MMAIQAVEKELVNLSEELKSVPEDDREHADIQELQLAYWKAASELEDAYRIERLVTSNLPPYEQLVRHKKSSD